MVAGDGCPVMVVADGEKTFEKCAVSAPTGGAYASVRLLSLITSSTYFQVLLLQVRTKSSTCSDAASIHAFRFALQTDK